MANHAQIAIAIKKLFGKGRPAVDTVEKPLPATVAELLAVLDARTVDNRLRRDPFRVGNEPAANAMRHHCPPCCQRLGGLISPSDPIERWQPPKTSERANLRQAALWAKGAIAWMTKHGEAVDLNWHIAATDDLAVIADDGKGMVWLCELSKRFDDAFFKATGEAWFEGVIFAEPLDIEEGLDDVASCNAYIRTFDLEAMEDANPPLILLDMFMGCCGESEGDIGIGEVEGFLQALEQIRLPVNSARQCLKKIAQMKDKWALPACWQSAITGLIAWGNYTDGPWAYHGDTEACNAGTVDLHTSRPIEYFEFIEKLIGARKRLFAAMKDLITQVNKDPLKFWREFARHIHDTIEAHPDWKIELKDEAAENKLLINVIA